MRGGSINPIYNDFINFLESKDLEKKKIITFVVMDIAVTMQELKS